MHSFKTVVIANISSLWSKFKANVIVITEPVCKKLGIFN